MSRANKYILGQQTTKWTRQRNWNEFLGEVLSNIKLKKQKAKDNGRKKTR